MVSTKMRLPLTARTLAAIDSLPIYEYGKELLKLCIECDLKTLMADGAVPKFWFRLKQSYSGQNPVMIFELPQSVDIEAMRRAGPALTDEEEYVAALIERIARRYGSSCQLDVTWNRRKRDEQHLRDRLDRLASEETSEGEEDYLTNLFV